MRRIILLLNLPVVCLTRLRLVKNLLVIEINLDYYQIKLKGTIYVFPNYIFGAFYSNKLKFYSYICLIYHIIHWLQFIYFWKYLPICEMFQMLNIANDKGIQKWIIPMNGSKILNKNLFRFGSISKSGSSYWDDIIWQTIKYCKNCANINLNTTTFWRTKI